MEALISFSDFLALLGVMGAAVGALIGGGKWLLEVYKKKETEISTLRSKFRESEMKQVNESIATLKRITEDHSQKIREATLSLEKSYMRYNAQTDAVKSVAEQIKEVSKEMRDEVHEMRSTLVKVTQDVAILKSRKTH